MDNDPHDKNPSECIAHCIAVIFAHVRVDDAWKACQLRREEHVNIIRHFNQLLMSFQALGTKGLVKCGTKINVEVI